MLSFKTDYDDGEALLVNISTSGCAIRDARPALQTEQKVLVSLALDNPNNPVFIRAHVIRAEGSGYGLQFHHLEENVKRRLVRFFARETRLHKSVISPAA